VYSDTGAVFRSINGIFYSSGQIYNYTKCLSTCLLNEVLIRNEDGQKFRVKNIKA